MRAARFDEYGIEDIPLTLEELRPERMVADVTPVLRDTSKAFGAAELGSLGVTTSFTMINPITVSHLEKFSSTMVGGINDTTREALRRELVEGVRRGEGMREQRRRVQKVMSEASNTRAMMIARTEVLNAANSAIHAAQVQSGVVSRRSWLATRDARVRRRHARLHGQEVGVREPFTVDGMKVMRPGQFPTKGDNIQCRCTTIAVFKRDALRADDVAAIFAAFDARSAPFERRVELLFRRIFSEQARSILASMRRLNR